MMWQRFFAAWWRKLPFRVKRTIVRATQPSFTVSAGVVVFDDENRVLLLDHVLRPRAGWGIPGGFLKAGEQPPTAAKREIFEETGLDINALELIEARTINRHVEFLYRARANGAATAKSREIIAAKWFALDRLPAELNSRETDLIRRAARIGEPERLSYSVGN